MGNDDDFVSAMKNAGTNKVIKFDGGYFSFAFGNEIALVLDDISGYFILNCGYNLFDEVTKKVESGMTKKDIINFWKDKSEEYKISDYSGDFRNL